MSTEKEKPYYLQRAEELGVTDIENLLSVYVPNQEEPKMLHLLYTDGKDDNMLILYLDLQMREGSFVALTYTTEVTSSFTQHTSKAVVIYQNTRLKKPIGTNKYKLPAGAPAHPFLPPQLIEAFNKKQEIPILFMTEGSLKALKGTLHGAFTVGINGIWGMAAKGQTQIHPVIKKIIEVCKVQHVVYMHDNDFREINWGYLKDIGERPRNFAETLIKYQKAAKKFKGPSVKFYYGHPLEDGPKGLDDVLIHHKGAEAKVVAEMQQLTAAKEYFRFFNIIDDFKNLIDIKKYFFIDSIDSFYNNHSDVIQDQEFIFLGDFYKYDESDDRVEMTLPKEVNDYLLVGNKYYKKIFELNSKGHPEQVRSQRNSEIILNDFRRMGKNKQQAEDLALKIPKFEGFVNEPNFIHFQQEFIIHERFKMLNLAYRLDHEPAPGDWPNIEQFLRHIFYNGGESKYEVGLDMIQMYYTMPCQIQRILALVSAGNETGKTKFLELMRAIFGQNMSIIGSADFASQFNPYIVKSLVGVDESKIDDPKIIEMIKSMVTNAYAMMNDKGISAVQVVNRVKLIMTTNHIFDFASIKEEENKWFVIEVGTVKNKDKNLMEKMQAEIPGFLYFLLHREMKHYSNESRFAIPDHVIETKALDRIKANSKPEVLKIILEYLQDRFDEFGEDEIYIDAKRLHEIVFGEKNFKYSSNMVGNTIKQQLDLETTKITKPFKVPFSEIDGQETTDEDTGEIIPPPVRITWKHYTGKIFTFKKSEFG